MKEKSTTYIKGHLTLFIEIHLC